MNRYPLAREADDIEYIEANVVPLEPVDKKRQSSAEESVVGKKARKKDTSELINLRLLNATESQQHEDEITSFMQSDSIFVYNRVPYKGVANPKQEAVRMPSQTEHKVFTFDCEGPPPQKVEILYPVELFPNNFINAETEDGNRLKCVVLLTANGLIYVSSVKAELRLCNILYAGTPFDAANTSKIRWERSVLPKNLVPNNWGSFAVSDRVIFDKLQKYAALLDTHRKECNVVSTSTLNLTGAAVGLKDTDVETAAIPKEQSNSFDLFMADCQLFKGEPHQFRANLILRALRWYHQEGLPTPSNFRQMCSSIHNNMKGGDHSHAIYIMETYLGGCK